MKILLFLTSLMVVGCSTQSSSEAGSTIKQAIGPRKSERACTHDSDCILVDDGCGCCEHASISKKSLDSFVKRRESQCDASRKEEEKDGGPIVCDCQPWQGRFKETCSQQICNSTETPRKKADDLPREEVKTVQQSKQIFNTIIQASGTRALIWVENPNVGEIYIVAQEETTVGELKVLKARKNRAICEVILGVAPVGAVVKKK